jgi:MerR family transcriptional regulator, copper efflux regulator
VSAKMIRYYESIGLVSAAARAANGYRAYAEADVHTLRFIKRARDLGFGVEQIRTLVGLWRDSRRSSAKVKQVALAHVADLNRKVVELQSMAAALEHLAGHCHGDRRPECPILDDLEGIISAPKPRVSTPVRRAGRVMTAHRVRGRVLTARKRADTRRAR